MPSFKIGDTVIVPERFQEDIRNNGYSWNYKLIHLPFTIDTIYNPSGLRPHVSGPIKGKGGVNQAWYCDELELFEPLPKPEQLIKKVKQLWERSEYYKTHVSRVQF